jgi:hypoxanthine phosphoribosyltransferase
MTDTVLADALARAELVHDLATLDAAITRVGAEVDATLGADGAVLLTVMQGGLIFAGKLAPSIRAPLTFDYVHATRYRGGTRGAELVWLREPAVPLAGRNVILADDILDEGHTLRAVRDYCRERGAARVLIAVLCAKRHGRCVPGLEADFVGVEVPDRYVFGFGMDYVERGRNLPGIYAVDA